MDSFVTSILATNKTNDEWERKDNFLEGRPPRKILRAAIVKLTSTLKATAEWQKVDRTRLAQRLCGFKHFYTSTLAVKRAGNEPGGVALHESTCKLYGEEGSALKGEDLTGLRVTLQRGYNRLRTLLHGLFAFVRPNTSYAREYGK